MGVSQAQGNVALVDEISDAEVIGGRSSTIPAGESTAAQPWSRVNGGLVAHDKRGDLLRLRDRLGPSVPAVDGVYDQDRLTFTDVDALDEVGDLAHEVEYPLISCQRRKVLLIRIPLRLQGIRYDRREPSTVSPQTLA